MQHPLRLLFALATVFVFAFCKNTPADTKVAPPDTKTVAADTSTFTTPRDTLVGFKGMERSGYTRPTPGAAEYLYQHYKIRTIDLPNEPGQAITITQLDSSLTYSVPSGIKGFFMGIYGNRLFIDIGTGPDVREFLVYDLKAKKALHKAPYVGDPEVLDNGKLFYLRPAKEEEITKMPDCPDRADWEKNGLGVGYGQVCLYNLTANTEIRKSEWRCVPMQ